MYFMLKPVMVSLFNHTSTNSVITQLKKIQILNYVPTHYSSIVFGSLHYYRPSLIILTRK